MYNELLEHFVILRYHLKQYVLYQRFPFYMYSSLQIHYFLQTFQFDVLRTIWTLHRL